MVPDLSSLCTVMHIRLYTLRYVHPEPMCSLVMGYDGDVDSFHDQDAPE